MFSVSLSRWKDKLYEVGEEVRGSAGMAKKKLLGFRILRINFADWRILNARRFTDFFNISAWITDLDSRSDEQETETDVSELNRGSTFLLGTTTRFGRQVQINSRLTSVMTGISLTSVTL